MWQPKAARDRNRFLVLEDIILAFPRGEISEAKLLLIWSEQHPRPFSLVDAFLSGLQLASGKKNGRGFLPRPVNQHSRNTSPSQIPLRFARSENPACTFNAGESDAQESNRRAAIRHTRQIFIAGRSERSPTTARLGDDHHKSQNVSRR